MPCKHLRVWQENLPNALFVNHYGPTEITASCTYYIVRDKVSAEDVLPIGVPFANTDILLLDESGAAVPDGETGEICVRGAGLALGYYKDPERTAGSFVPNPLQELYEERIYKTGDMGSRMPDGNLAFHGRKDFQIKHMGHRIELSEIEGVATAMESVQSCCCLYHPEKETIWLFYTGKADNRGLSLFLRERLPSYMIPRKFVKLGEMPKTFIGKIDMEKLRAAMRGDAAL
jgi:acyl-coenzyme A synthetase/AMP-(fatty) acid ligase